MQGGRLVTSMRMEVMPMTTYESISLLVQLSVVWLMVITILLSVIFFLLKKK